MYVNYTCNKWFTVTKIKILKHFLLGSGVWWFIYLSLFCVSHISTILNFVFLTWKKGIICVIWSWIFMLYLMKNILTNPAVWKKTCSNCRCQGACVASIKPEYLLEPRDYHLWKQMQKQLKLELAKQGEVNQANKMEEEEELEEDVFEAVSKRSWTDVLLQLLKVTSGAV